MVKFLLILLWFQEVFLVKMAKDHHLYCAVIIKQVDEKTRSKTSINDLLRE